MDNEAKLIESPKDAIMLGIFAVTMAVSLAGLYQMGRDAKDVIAEKLQERKQKKQ